eukprot:753067-Hanusia_phi.AAC.1
MHHCRSAQKRGVLRPVQSLKQIKKKVKACDGLSCTAMLAMGEEPNSHAPCGTPATWDTAPAAYAGN